MPQYDMNEYERLTEHTPEPPDLYQGGPLVLKWWPVIAAMIAWAVAGLLAFGSVKADISGVDVRLTAHEKAQQETIRQMHDDLVYIRERLDKALEKQK